MPKSFETGKDAFSVPPHQMGLLLILCFLAVRAWPLPEIPEMGLRFLLVALPCGFGLTSLGFAFVVTFKIEKFSQNLFTRSWLIGLGAIMLGGICAIVLAGLKSGTT